ncbi:MAG: hypothetical protein OXF84_10885 [Bacteroidetes bacterium]|nr:hypothetical protein [Bacteroidota bacterium]
MGHLFLDLGKTSNWIPQKTKVVIRKGDGQSSLHDTLLYEVYYEGSVVNARRIELEDQ